MTLSRHWIGWLAAVAIFALAAPGSVLAMGTDKPPEPSSAGDTKDDKAKADDAKADAAKPAETKGPDQKPAETKEPEKKSQNDFLNGYRHAYDLIYKHQDYAAGIAALRALGHDDHPDVANLVGFSSRKLGRTDDAKLWYEKALAADPKHTRTWQYYGMWHLEQGNRLKAQEHLEKIQLICGGTACEDYQSLRNALDGKMSY